MTASLFFAIFDAVQTETAMKRILITILTLAFICTTHISAQPRAMGLRAGACGIEASYQHKLNNKRFIGADLGLDFGYNCSGNPGARFCTTYNFIWASPAWTEKGTWTLYGGPGLFAGAGEDLMAIRVGDEIAGSINKHGFVAGLALQFGLEFKLRIPLHISVDTRPYFGVHINKDQTGFYENGLLGFAPSLAVRYMF